MSLRWYQALPSLGVLASVLSGCSGGSNAPVSIDYRQIGFCNTYATSSGERAAKPNEVFIVYKIDAVDNTKRKTEFTFFPTRLYVERATVKEAAAGGTNKTPPGTKPESIRTPWIAKPGETQTPEWMTRLGSRRFLPNDTGFAQAMGVQALAPMVVSPAAKTAINGYSVVAVVKPEEDRPVDQISFSLNYDPQEGDGGSIAADPPIVLNDTRAAQTSWPHPDKCQELTLDKPSG